MFLPTYSHTQEDYLFRQIEERVSLFRQKAHITPINMGVGDVCAPLAPCVVEAMCQAALQMGQEEGFRGYSPPFGYSFARQAVVDYYRSLGASIAIDDVYISSGAKDDLARWCGLVDPAVPALLGDPIYPAHRDWQLLLGREIVYAPVDDTLLPVPYGLQQRPYLILLCSPNNPLGASYTPSRLSNWVNFALQTRSLLLLDAAYQLFAPKPFSVYSIPDADKCCVEIGTLSKCASFSGVRFGWSIVPKLVLEGEATRVWQRALSTLTNGVGYVTQRAGWAALSPEGMAFQRQTVARYDSWADQIARCLAEAGHTVQKGPYLWLKMPYMAGGWQYFDLFLSNGVIVTPGEGFGSHGRGYVRLSVFDLHDQTQEACRRLLRALQKTN